MTCIVQDAGHFCLGGMIGEYYFTVNAAPS